MCGLQGGSSGSKIELGDLHAGMDQHHSNEDVPMRLRAEVIKHFQPRPIFASQSHQPLMS